MELSSAYWRIPLREENIHKISFVLPKVKYEWLIMQFDSKDAVFSLAYVMDNILVEFKKAKPFSMIVFSTARELNILILFKKCHQNSQNTAFI